LKIKIISYITEMITLISGCILAGCLQDVPYIVGDPVRYYLTPTRKESIDKSQYSCCVNGEFFKSCPK
jgi:hypothetical protein